MSDSTSGPLTCEDVRRQLPLLMTGRVDAELHGRLDGHMAMCAECCTDMARRRAMAIIAGTISKPAEAQVERVASVIYPIRRSVHTGKVGMMWQRGTSCRTLHAEDCRTMDRARRRLGDAMERSRDRFAQPHSSIPPRTAIRTRGSQVVRPRLRIEVLDAAWESTPGEFVECELAQGPVISGDGVFRMSVDLRRQEFERYQDRVVICTLTADEEKIGFEAMISTPRIEFVAEDLPKLGGVTPVDPAWLRLYLAPHGYAANG